YDGGTVHTLARNDGALKNSDFPTRLSETGLFASVKDHAPAAGVVPFAVNGRQWLDGATAEHWAAFPGNSAATLHATGKPIPGMGYIRRADKDGKPLPPFDAAAAARERKVADPADTAQPVQARARGYLHANCGHCHFEHGGGTVALRLQFSVPNAEMKAIGVR